MDSCTRLISCIQLDGFSEETAIPCPLSPRLLPQETPLAALALMGLFCL
jgi:hypothetical protein